MQKKNMGPENSNHQNNEGQDALSREIFSIDENEKSTLPMIAPPLLPHIPERDERSIVPVPLVLILVALISYVTGYLTLTSKPFSGDDAAPAEKVVLASFEQLALEARAAYAYDVLNDRVLYAYNEHEVLPLASLTKLMAAVIARETLPSDSVITIGANDIKTEGDTGLRVGERWKLSDIIGFTLMTSSNDGASALATAAGSLGQHEYDESPEQARTAFVEKMNLKAAELGLRGTRFFNGTGLDLDGEISGGYGTARDMGTLMAHAVKTMYKDLSMTTLPKTSISSLMNISHNSTNTNERVGDIPNLIASKTGYTDLAGGNLVIAFDAGLMRPIIVVVLGSTREGRFSDVEKLSWAALESLRNPSDR